MRAVLLPGSPLLLALAGCLPELPEEKSAVEGEAAGDCTDRADNDRDGAFDCDDDGCAASPDCTAPAAPPEGLAIAVTPAAPGDDDALSCTIVTPAVDPNGDAVQYAWAWSVDGEDAGNTGEGVAPGVTVPGQAWTCTVTPSDGVLTGTPASATVSIQRANGAPSAPVVAITPEAPTDEDGLSCAVVGESVDPDGDAVTYAWAWSVDGVDAGIADPSVDASRTRAGETWTCSVTASDGSASSAAGTASVGVVDCVPFHYLDFDGVDDYVQLPDVAGLGEGYTYEAWVRGAPASTYEHLFMTSCGDVAWTAAGAVITLFPSCTGTSAQYTSDFPSASYPDPSLAFADWPSGWFHVAATITPDLAQFFVDGRRVASGSLSYDNGVGGRNGNTLMARFDLNHGWSTGYADADLAGVRISRGERFGSDFVPSFPLTRDASTQTLYAMEDGSGSILTDSGPGGNDATIEGATWRTDCR
jgi:hypothetical protein